MKKLLFATCAVLLVMLLWQNASAFKGMGVGSSISSLNPIYEGTIKIGPVAGSGQVWLYDASGNPTYKLAGNGYLACANGGGLSSGTSATVAGSGTDLYFTRAAINQWKITTDNAATYADLRLNAICSSLTVRRSATQTVTDSTTLAIDDTLAVTLLINKKYEFDLVYYFTTTATTSGVKIDLNGGTAVMSSIQGDGIVANLSTFALAAGNEITALTTTTGVTILGTSTKVEARGVFVVGTAGTFAPRFAQNAETGAAESVVAKANSFLMVQEIP